MTKTITDDEDLTPDGEFDERQQPGWLPSTSELDTILQDVNKDHSICRWDPEKEDHCEPATWHHNVCADNAASIGGHGYLTDWFGAPDTLERAHERGDCPEPAVVYAYLSTTAAFYLLRETRALRDEQAARHEEAMDVQRQILEELRHR
jgi:hypothetical protein